MEAVGLRGHLDMHAKGMVTHESPRNGAIWSVFPQNHITFQDADLLWFVNDGF